MKTSFWKLNQVVALAAILVSLPCQSFAGPRDSGGGEDIGLDFQAAAFRALENISPKTLDPETHLRAVDVAKNAKYLKAEKALSLTDPNGETFDPIAINIPSEQSIYIDEKWNSLGKEEVRQSLALHEILSLMKIEKTGDYHISSQLQNSELSPKTLAVANAVVTMNLTELQSYQQKLFSQMRDLDAKRTPYEILKELYETAPTPASQSDFAPCSEKLEAPLPGYYQLLMVKYADGTNVGQTFINPETSNQDILDTAQDFGKMQRVYIGTTNSRYLINPEVPASPAVPGQGPLFPGKPAQSEQSAVYGNYPTQLTLINTMYAGFAFSPIGTCVDRKTVDTVSDLTVNTNISRTDYISKMQYLNGSSLSYYVRKTGELLAIKVVSSSVDEHGKKETVVSYTYGWKD